ncbi:hypothetical protein VTO73DRAFT_1454 [Trametes versicolor]
MAQRQPTRASIEEDIEETQRQIRDSAELIQSAFDSLSSLHGRVTEVVSQRAQGRTPTPQQDARADRLKIPRVVREAEMEAPWTPATTPSSSLLPQTRLQLR